MASILQLRATTSRLSQSVSAAQMTFLRTLFRSSPDRLERARAAGAARGSFEAKLYRISRSGNAPDYYQALEWLQAVVHEGRTELKIQHAFDREVDAWEMSCRISFLIRLADLHERMTLSRHLH